MRTSKRKRETQAVVTQATASEQPVVVLPGTCTFREIAELKSNLLRWTARQDVVTVDVSSLERIDAAAMQVLCAFVRDRQNDKLPLQWRGSSEVMTEAARLLGLASVFELPQASA